jgi:plastocyanin
MMSAMSATSRRLRAIVPLVALAISAAACSSGNNVPVNSTGFGDNTAYTGAPSAVVTLKYSSFEPASVTIRSGQAVQWSWQDFGITHDVRIYAPGGSVLAQSPTMGSGTWSYAFANPGAYPYLSTVDAKMGGTVVVNP